MPSAIRYCLCVLSLTAAAQSAELTPLELLGKKLFFDTNLSNPAGQSCASCHAPETGFSGPSSQINLETGIYPGAAPGRFGNRKPPSAAYASFSPALEYEASDETYVGGQFWDGRAANLVEQAKGPFLNPLEMNNASAADVVSKLRRAEYRQLFEIVNGAGSLQADTDAVFDLIAQAIAAYESSSEVNAFSSKYDAYLAGLVKLSHQEKRGLDLFVGKANCAACHPSDPGSDGSPPLFTDYTYDNVGAPRNARNPFYGQAASVNPSGARYRDLGIGGVLKQEEHWGKVKVPTLRNVARKPNPDFVKAYLHNGCFKSLKEVVHFYNRRDASPTEFGAPDVVENVNGEELGDLGLSAEEEDDLVAFLETLSDGYFTPSARPPAVPVVSPAPGPDTVPDLDPRPDSPDPVPTLLPAFRGAQDVARIRRFQQRRSNLARQPGSPVR